MVCLKPFSPLSHALAESLSPAVLQVPLLGSSITWRMNCSWTHSRTPCNAGALLCCPSSRAGEVPHEDQGLGRWGCSCLPTEVLIHLFFLVGWPIAVPHFNVTCPCLPLILALKPSVSISSIPVPPFKGIIQIKSLENIFQVYKVAIFFLLFLWKY